MNNDNMFISDWKNECLGILSQMFPSLTDEQITQVLNDDVEENFKDPMSMLHNDYLDDGQGNDIIMKQPLTTIYKFCKVNKPILAGNGTFFYNQDKYSSPIADLIDSRIAERKEAQRTRDTYPKASEQYVYYEIVQMERKVRVNSIYGSFGAPTFQLYNKYTAASTTGTAQSLISTTAVAFESFIGDNVKFKSFGECIVFMVNIINEKYELPRLNIKSHGIDDVYDRLVNNFAEDAWDDESMSDLLMDFLETLTPEQLTNIYYKNNLYEFIKNDDIAEILIQTFNHMNSFNNPNEVPEEISDDMNYLWEYVNEYVFYNYAYTERINRTKNDYRSVVKLIDTDSNLIHVQPWVDFLKELVIPKVSAVHDEDTEMFACVNILAFLVTQMLRKLLDKYCNDCNVLERYWKRVNMKNEFCFSKLLVSNVKKRYVAKIILREGQLMNKTEIKGHDFKKSGVTEYVSKLMQTIVENRILNVPTVDIPGILSDLSKVETDIISSIKNGQRDFLLRMNCKVPEAYADPYSQGQVLSVLAWNVMFPDNEIMPPDKLDVILMNMPNKESIKDLEKVDKALYDRLIKNIYDGPIEAFRRRGIVYLAIPNNIEEIPDVVKPYINYDYITSRIIGTFRSILDSLDIPAIGSNSMSHFSNIRRNTNIEI